MSDFRHHAACRDADPELFFPIGESEPARRQIAAAKAVCRRCPVMEKCLAWALHAGHEHGVWGGRDTAERRELHRRARFVDAPTPASGSGPSSRPDTPRTAPSITAGAR